MTEPAQNAPDPTRTALVVGASGITGTALVDQLLDEGWEVLALSRGGSARDGVTGVAANLREVDSLRAALSEHRPTHVFFTAWQRQDTEAENIAVNPLLGVASTNFAYFYWYTVVRSLYMANRTLQASPSTPVELSLGALAGALAQLFTIPVAVVTTRQQTMSKAERKGMIATAMDVVNGEDGWTGLWRGLRASLVLVVNPSITYGAYQRLREVLYPGKKTLKPLEAFRKSRLLLLLK